MDQSKRKELLQNYKNRHPEMGIISYRCIETNQSFICISRDTKASFNRSSFDLLMGTHKNAALQKLWKQYGKENFELSVLKVLTYDQREDDHDRDLQNLLTLCLEADPSACIL